MKKKKTKSDKMTPFQRSCIAVQTSIDYRDFERDTVNSIRNAKYPNDKFNPYKEFFRS